MLLGREPTLIIQSVQAVLQGINVVAIPWNGTVNQAAHVAIALILAAIAALLNRSVVSPA